MRIYICLPASVLLGEPFRSTQEGIRSDMCDVLKKYYGNFAPSGIEFFKNASDGVAVYVMEQARHSKAEAEIRGRIEQVIKKSISTGSVDVRLNYHRLKPNFRPDALALSATKPAPVRGDAAKNKNEGGGNLEEFDYAKLSLNYQADEPHYSFEQLILPQSVSDKIMEAVATIQVEPTVFDEWGLRSIIPYATSAMSFYGPPGTGKTMAAEAVAKKLGKKIIRATYADIESKFHGEGPKMVKAIFRAAEREDAVLFLDESDSLLSKRLTNVTEGSAQAINSMRSQLLICLEQFRGIVIFATNLVVNYDKAFLSRLISIEFPVPDAEARRVIWQQHIRGSGIRIPLADDVDIAELAEKYSFCGREIKNAVKDACVTVAMREGNLVAQEDFIKSCEKTKIESERVLNAADHTQSRSPLTPQQNEALKDILGRNLINEEDLREKNYLTLQLDPKYAKEFSEEGF